MRFLKATTLYILLFSLLMPLSAYSAMQSENYVIYENVLHTFDGPVISDVSSSVSGAAATIAWTTNVAADSFVIYDTDSGFLNSHEQGNSSKTFTSHSVDLAGLSENTTYYYRVRSERVNGGITTDTTSRSFTTGSTVVPGGEEEEEAAPGGGGILIIDKTDKEPPEISNVAVDSVEAGSATISWETDEESTSFVEYGSDANYGKTYGSWATTTRHSVTLDNLNNNQTYYFRVLSSDFWGNVGYSDGDNFTTGAVEGEEEEEEEIAEEEETSIIADATQRVFDFISRLFPEVSLNLRPEDLANIETYEDLESLVAAPVLSGEPRLEIGATEATIYWTTDIESNSQVAIAPSDEYNALASEPYLQVIGNLENFTTEHEVTVYGLTPDTEYHYQLRSKAEFGPTSRSRDFIFRTNLEELEITSFFPQVIDDQTAVFKWITNKEADTSLTFAPYEGNNLSIEKSKTFRDNSMSIIHEVTVSEFVGGTEYRVELQSTDEKGNVASAELDPFSTAEDDRPPEISHIKADSTVFLDRGDKIQTVISWLTNEPSTSRVFYKEGVHANVEDLTESTQLNTDYIKEHVVVVSRFKPGMVYSFRVESTDSGGNTTLSKVHTFMTAQKQESIIQMIIRILGESFGWIRKII